MNKANVHIPGGSMFGGLEPGEMTSEERAGEIAAILARGFLRMRQNGQYLGDSPASQNASSPITDDISKDYATDKSPS